MMHIWHKWGGIKQWGGIQQRKCLVCGKLEKDVIAIDGCGGMIKFLEEEERRKRLWEKEKENQKGRRDANPG